ncbi:hypothetical protein ACFSCX_06360 [Bacillus salitolerans]|uniref:Uncharacterized protein n=1 Tax=Bacillus salitolerans TaxID=1437434 RepID=A0ABW4LLY4_9BACI
MKFDLKKMKKLAEVDALIKFQVTDLTKRLGSEDEAYQIVFNSEVLDAPEFEEVYNNL